MKKIKLSDETLAEVRNAQRELHDTLAEIDKLERCGTDCQLLRQSYSEAMQKTEAILREYGSSI